MRSATSVIQPHGGLRDGWSGAGGPGQEAVGDLGSVGIPGQRGLEETL